MGIDITGIGTLASAAEGIINHFFPDKTEQQKSEMAMEMQSLMNEYNLVKGQIDTNIEESKSTNWFIAGWRPFVGWVGGFALAYAALFEPFMRFIAVQVGFTGTFPVIDTSITLQVLMGLLGLAGMRSFEKHQNVEGNR